MGAWRPPDLRSQPQLLGHPGQDQDRHLQVEQRGSRQLTASSRAKPTASTTPIPTTSKLSRAIPTSSSIPREALNVFYLGMNNTKTPLDNEKVRQAIAMGIDRAGHRRQVLSHRLLRRRLTSPPAPSPVAARATSGMPTTWMPPSKLSARLGRPASDQAQAVLSRRGAWLSAHAAARWPKSSRLSSRTSASTSPSTYRNWARSSTTPPRATSSSSCLAGALTTPTRPTSWMLTSARARTTPLARSSTTSPRS